MYVDLISSIQPLTEEMPNIAEELSSPVIALTAGAPCSPTLFNKIRDTFGIKHLISAFGMTEISPVAFLSTLNDTEDQMLNYIGRPMPYQEVKVVDKKGNIVPMGMCGEVCYRGYNVMLGYYGEENKILENDEWFPSGDFFILHENGYGQVVGRIKDIIIRGGENIIPKEIEYVLQTHPDIVEAQVYGVPDERLGEVVVANIELKPGASLTQDDIKTYYRSFQNPPPCPVCLFVSQNGNRENPEVQTPRPLHQGIPVQLIITIHVNRTHDLLTPRPVITVTKTSS
ncbi:hypothetical protein M8J76_005069 [Diaphorina citri]|nr:hypothetical protein M8J76_005069 [Diaphorina citri]